MKEVTARIRSKNREVLNPHPLAGATTAERHRIADEQRHNLDGMIANIYDKHIDFNLVKIYLLSHFRTIYSTLGIFKCILLRWRRRVTKQ